MRILHVLHNSLPLLCGYSIRSGYIVNLQRAQGLDPWVVTSGQHPNGESMREIIDGVEYRRTPAAAPSRVPFRRELHLMRMLERQVESAAREIKPDVIHAHSPVLVGLPSLRVARRLGIPMVYEIRDLWENASVDRGRFSPSSPLYKLARGLESYVVSRADAVVTICDLLRQELVPRAGRADKVHVVANGVDVESFHERPASQRVKEQWGLVEKDVILYAGTFQPYEGLDLLVRAIGEVVKTRPRAHLVIVGGTAGLAGGAASMSPEEARLRAIARDCSLDAHVTFTGRIPHHDVQDMYALADVLAYPRRWTRTTALTTPLKPLEAMAMARAVIVSDLPPMRELVSDDVTGLLFSAGDHLDLAAKCTALLADSVRRRRLGTAARDWVTRERQWRTLVFAYQQIYRSVLSPSVAEPMRRPA
jgi:PEP-CTERM/exosortase A-associated glycosyltransferase